MTNQHSSAPTFVSLYSGAGGLDIGFAQAGFRPVFGNDIAPDAVRTHNNIQFVQDPQWRTAARMFQGTRAIAGDVREVGSSLAEGMADLVIGGPPCQGFSVAGKMDPEDPRSKHVFDFLGLVARIKPRAFVMENVAALARNTRWKDVIASLKDIASVEYKVQLVVLNAAEWGVPQARERMFLIGIPTDCPDLDFGDAPNRDNPKTVRETLSELPPAGDRGNNSMCTAKITLAKHPVLRRSPFAGMLFNGQGRVINLDAASPTLPASMGGNRTPIIDTDSLQDATSTPWIVKYHKRLFEDHDSPLKAIPKNAHMRRITVEEAAAIQTFPKDLKWEGSQSSQYRQIGNAVPPLLAFHVAEHLKKALGY
ncbi:MAG: DNA cytosine methyltransferase [Actinomycetaceae bacterium]|nr:DNA cytosine methyltransferase [Actinomycetaceae bacterium]MDY5273991.1 DNA cytosine methyltransferase [Arcanobacterium sp.]